jgi:Gpi18-like mannosyltransferase
MDIRKKIRYLKSKYIGLSKYALDHEWMLAILLAFAVVMIGLAMGAENNKIISTNPLQVAHYSLEPTNRLSFLANWDGVDYISVSLHGYTTAFMTGFFPFYPVLIFILHKIIGSSLIDALTISWACLVGAIYYYLKIIKFYFKITDNTEALKAALLFVLFPSGVYLLSAYTESLFALLSLGAIYYALRKSYVKTGLLAALATATHINGAFSLLLVVLILIEERERVRNVFITLVIGSLGLISYMTYLLFRYHNPLEFIDAQKDHHWLQSPLISQLGSFGIIDYTLVVIIILTTVYWWKRRKSFAIYSGLFLLIPLVGGQFGGYPRYTLMVFPLQFMLFEYFRNKKFAYAVVLILFGMGWTYITLRYAAGYVTS